jgi:hypothetical protein
MPMGQGLLVVLATVFVAANVLADECKFGKRVVTGPTGKTIVACLDGKYKTCLFDSQRAGFSREHALDHCGKLRDLGRIK